MGSSKVGTKNLQNQNTETEFTKSYNQTIDNSCNSSIRKFYENSVIFVTGGTGFVGKALIEKLLRSCDGLQTIYILLRPKRGLNVDQRLKELIKNPVFDRIRSKHPEYFDKIKVVSGDVSQPNLGLNNIDRKMLTANVTIAFHSAATVKFNENLKDALLLNTLGTQRVIELCKEMVNLKSFVHVSTAYSNADKYEIKEIVYPPPHNPKMLMQCMDSLPAEAIAVITDQIQGNHPNTYTITKAMAEHIVAEEASDLPVAIVRPSIVTGAWKEPFPGWVDNVCGITGIMMEIGRGTIRSIICDQSLTMDLIPVDVVVNTLITAAWHTTVHRSSTLRVYNCTSGQLNGVKWHEFGEMTKKYAIENPTKYVMFYPGFTFRTNRFMHKLADIFLHTAPAIVFDLLLKAQGSKPIMLKISNRFKRAAVTGEFFALNEWDFETTNVKMLIKDLTSFASDHEEFQCDITNGFEWDPYVKSYMLGIRKFVLKDDVETLPNARKKLQRLYWTYRVVQSITLFCFIYKLLLRV